MQPSQQAVIRELEGLRALARSLVHGDAEVDDLLQDTAVAALEHPPQLDRPVRPWLATVLRNRWRMDRREASRREVREQAVASAQDPLVGDPIDGTVARARMLEKLAAALVALDEPFRTAVIRRYLDGETSAQIARRLGVPAATVRWRLATGLARLRDALAESEPKWTRVLLPFAALPTMTPTPTPAATTATVSSLAKGALLVKLKTKLVVLIALALLVGGVMYVTRGRGDAENPATPIAQQPATPAIEKPVASASASARDPLPGQGKAVVETVSVPGGLAQGRVVNWSTGEGVSGAELTFTAIDATAEGGVTTVRTHDDGVFELAPPAPGRYTLAAIGAQGFLPYAPEYQHSTVSVTLLPDRAVKGITVFLFPALDYHGTVVDRGGTPVAGAKVRLLGTPAGEQAIDKLQTEWTSDKDGAFVFHAADEAVLEAERGGKRGWARLDQTVETTHRMTIMLGDAPARDRTISGHVVDESGAAVPDVLVGAMPAGNYDDARNPSFAVSGPDGAFKLDHLDRDSYDLTGHADDRAPAVLREVKGGTQNVTLVCEGGLSIAGTATTAEGAAVPSFTLTVFAKDGARRELVAARSIVDPQGRFSVRVHKGDFELIAAATGLAPSKPTPVVVESSVKDVRLTVSVGGVLRGLVQGLDGKPISRARVMREARGGGASAQPANAGTVTRADGTFELTGIPPGPFSIDIGAGGFNPRIEGGLTVEDGQSIGPLTYVLSPLVEGEEPKVELVGIGLALAADSDGLVVTKVIDGGGGKAAGIVVGDHVVAIDGMLTTELGMDGSIGKIRGVEGTSLSVSIKRGDQTLELLVVRRKIRA